MPRHPLWGSGSPWVGAAGREACRGSEPSARLEAETRRGLSGRCPLVLPQPGLVSILPLKLLWVAPGYAWSVLGQSAPPCSPPATRAEKELPGMVVMVTWWPLLAGEGHLSACRLRSALSRLGAKTAFLCSQLPACEAGTGAAAPPPGAGAQTGYPQVTLGSPSGQKGRLGVWWPPSRPTESSYSAEISGSGRPRNAHTHPSWAYSGPVAWLTGLMRQAW